MISPRGYDVPLLEVALFSEQRLPRSVRTNELTRKEFLSRALFLLLVWPLGSKFSEAIFLPGQRAGYPPRTPGMSPLLGGERLARPVLRQSPVNITAQDTTAGAVIQLDFLKAYLTVEDKMTRRIVVWGTLALLVAGLAFVVAAQKKTDLPPGVLAEMWIPINESAGVALNYEGSRYEPSALTHGTLMIKSHGSWKKVYLDLAPEKHGFMPVIR